MNRLRLRIASFAIACLFAATASAQAPVRLGVSATMTGPNAVNGVSTVNGLKLALEHLNAAGGVEGKPIVLDVKDDKGTPAEAQTVFDQLIKSNVMMIFGPTLTPQAEQAWVFSDGAKVVDGYTNLEHYLHSLTRAQ